jgi:ubiquinone/menaquinone biosynthesis C-methylase UbiE
MSEPPHLAGEILSYYERNDEAHRLETSVGLLELARTQEIVRRYLPRPPAIVLDVGGGPGAHAAWLARDGYEVHLRDPVRRLVDQSQARSAQQPDFPIASSREGDARAMEVADESIDAVLLLGPLYHLPDRSDRVRALRETLRVLKPGGVALIAAISRYASLLDGLFRGYLDDPEFAAIVERDMADGVHHNTSGDLAYFTTAYFHRAADLAMEINESGLVHDSTLPVEGPGWLLQDFDVHWRDPERRKRLLDAVRAVENVPSLLGASAHWIAVARKKRSSGGQAALFE